MKTTITIENGKITVAVDDGMPVKIAAVPAKQVAVPPDMNKEQVARRTASTPSISKPRTLANPKTQTAPPAARTCIICGDDISRLSPLSKICKKPGCKRARQAQHARNHYRKQNGTERRSEQSEEKVDWCKHCQAYTTHDSANHPKPAIEPLFLPGHEKTPEEIEAWRPTKVSDPVPMMPHGATVSGFADPWDCAKCRHYNMLCEFHQGMEDNGKKPPKIHL